MYILLSAILFPILAGVILLLCPLKETHANEKANKSISFKALSIYTGITLIISFILIILGVSKAPFDVLDLFRLNDSLVMSFKADSIGRFFAVVMGLVWTCVGFFSFEYMKHEKNNKRYFGIYLLVLGVLMGLCFSANLTTYYTFYEFMTIGSFALVLHNQSREAIMAGLKYLFYSFAGAYMVLFGFYFVHQYADDKTMAFLEGGILKGDVPNVLMVALLLMILGFSVKAGMFPMHGWLPTAHPVAPAPASAALSAIIVKSGVLGIIRVIFYIFGEDLFIGSIVQNIVITLSLITVFIGSMLAYKEEVLKKRLAYSTVSQVSYILFGIFMMNTTAFKGSMIHVIAHAAIKSTLFLCAGAIIYITGCTKVSELRGIGRKMPVMLWCYTIVSLGLIGIPPFGGFTSKWYLGVGALEANMKGFSFIGPVVLLISALLTAGYLLPISINGFLPGNDFETKAGENPDDPMYKAYTVSHEPKLMMLIPILILTIVSVLVGMFPEVLSW